MSYRVRSLLTWSFWRYALFSGEAAAKLLATVGTLYLFLEILDTFQIYTKANFSKWALAPILLLAVFYVVISRRPAVRISHKIPQRDYCFEVKIGDLLLESADLVISTNTTFDTDIASGLIAANSLQGQVAIQLFQGNTAEIDRQLEAGLAETPFAERGGKPGKRREYPLGTVVKVRTHGKVLYFVAMARLNEHGTAHTSLRDLDDVLTKLWAFIASQGELRTIAMPLIGTGRGRVELPRKKMVERIAQSFADASRDTVFANKLVIMVHPGDADRFSVNLFEIRDFLVRSIHA